MRSALLAFAWTLTFIAHAESPFRVPEGFKVSTFAGDDLTHDTWAMAVSEEGHVAVSGPGYIKVLVDENKDGVADRAEVVSDSARNPHGLLWVGRDLMSVQPHGIFLHRDRTRDGIPESNPELFYKLPGGGGEHGPHGIRQGPDGWFYLACGNNTHIGKGNVTTETSPITEPSQGTILRISPDGKQSEVIAHGFRNHYDLAINKHGHLFTFDSDGERDHQLPWYSYCRVFHVRIGGHHGWLLPGHQRSFNRPPYFFDSVDRLVEIDRGSPTGVEVYRHTQFPKRYQDGLFFACWTYGRVYFTPLSRHGDTYRKLKPETFLETTGNLGFAPSDLAVHPTTGDLFVSIGGRGTRGSVYRISYPKRTNEAAPTPLYETGPDWSIHDDLLNPPPPLAPSDALALFNSDKASGVRLTAIRHLMLALGDISTSEAKRRIDAGYTANKPDAIDVHLRQKVSSKLVEAFAPNKPGDPLQYEIARLLAMLRADSAAAARALASAIHGKDPVHDLHYLFCLAQISGSRDHQSKQQIREGFLLLDDNIKRLKLLPDRNWAINVREAFEIHQQFDSELPAVLAKQLPITAGDTYLLASLPDDLRKAAAPRLLANSPLTHWDPEALQFVRKHLPENEQEKLLPLSRLLWRAQPQLRPNLASTLSQSGNADDKRRVQEFYQPLAHKLDLTPFNEKLALVDWSKGDAQRGQAAYARFNCVTCHSGNKRLGPLLKNIAKRFSRDDLFRHINEPNLAISDLYKATQITTKDGTYIGMKVYSSEAQTILETGSNETIRFSRHDILSERTPNQSPMPAGLLLPASKEDLADLYAYLKTL